MESIAGSAVRIPGPRDGARPPRDGRERGV